MKKDFQLVQFLAPKVIVGELDSERAKTGNSRSTLIRVALFEYLQRRPGGSD
jgi:metal-responsive CopG/Arc/MetJ family transcriptional regulator